MGDDDANEGASPGECLEHDFSMESLILVEKPGRMFPGLAMGLVCIHCETPAYEPSRLEKS